MKFKLSALALSLSFIALGGPQTGLDQGQTIKDWPAWRQDIFVRKDSSGSLKVLRLVSGRDFDLETRSSLNSEPISKSHFESKGYYRASSAAELDSDMYFISNGYDGLTPSIVRVDLTTGSFVESKKSFVSMIGHLFGDTTCPRLISLKPNKSGVFVNFRGVACSDTGPWYEGTSGTIMLDKTLAPMPGMAAVLHTVLVDPIEQTVVSWETCTPANSEKSCYKVDDLVKKQSFHFQVQQGYQKLITHNSKYWIVFSFDSDRSYMNLVDKKTFQIKSIELKGFPDGWADDFEAPIILPNEDLVLTASSYDKWTTKVYQFDREGIEKARISVQGNVTIRYQSGRRDPGESVVHANKLYLKTRVYHTYYNSFHEVIGVFTFGLHAISLDGKLEVLGSQEFYPYSTLPQELHLPKDLTSLDTRAWTNLKTLAGTGQIIVGTEKIEDRVSPDHSGHVNVVDAVTYVFDDRLRLQAKSDSAIVPHYFDGQWLIGSDFGPIGPFVYNPWHDIGPAEDQWSTYKLYEYQP